MTCPYHPLDGNYTLSGVTLNTASGGRADLRVAPVLRQPGGLTVGAIDSSNAVVSFQTSLKNLPGQRGWQSSQPTKFDRHGTGVSAQQWSYTQNDRGLIRTALNPLNQDTQFEYDPNDNITRVIDTLSHDVVLGWDARHNPTSVRDKNGIITSLSWFPTDDLRSVQRLNSSGTPTITEFAYDSHRNLTSIKDPEGHFTYFEYNGNGLLTEVRDHLGNATSFGYNSNGYLTSITDPETRVTTFQVDTLGRRTAVIDARQKRWDYAYDALDRLTSVTSPPDVDNVRAVTRWNWNADGTLRDIIDGNFKTTSYTYDKSQRVTQVNLPSVPDKIKYEYDPIGNVKRFYNPKDDFTEYSYDKLNRVTRVTYPGSDFEAYGYDTVGNLTTWDRNGAPQVRYGYDAGHRLTSIATTGTNIGYHYDTLDRLDSMTDASGSTSWEYFLDSTLKTVNYPGGKSVSYTYDEVNRTRSVTSSSGARTDYTWTARSQLQSATQGGKSFVYGYDFAENLTSIAYPNGISCNATYDDRGRVAQISYTNGGSPVASVDYTFDQVGNRRQRTLRNSSATTVEDYNYDDRYQVTSVARSINGTPAATVALAYDLNGNRSAKNGVPYNYNVADQLMSGGPEAVSMAYNGTGSASSLRIGTDLQQYTYDFRDMPTAIATANGTAHNVYNGLNQRLSHTATDGTVSNYLWSGDQLLTEFNGNQVKADYLLGVFREGIKTADGWRFYLRDGIGSIIALTDESGNVTDSYDYDEFGNLLASSSTTSYNPFMFSGEQFDADVGQYYLRNRFYQPQLGRFLVRDPIGYSGGMNLYAYVGNNPLNAVDPDGTIPVDTALDVVSIGVDLILIGINPTDPSGYFDLSTDIAAAATPYAPATGAVRGVSRTVKAGRLSRARKFVKSGEVWKLDALTRGKYLEDFLEQTRYAGEWGWSDPRELNHLQ